MSLSLFGESLTARVPVAVPIGLTLSACLLAAKLLDFDIAPALHLDSAIVPGGTSMLGAG